MEPAIQQLLNQHEFLEVIETGQDENKRVRVKCQLTQHEMLLHADVIATHLASKKFRKARDWYCHDYSQYEPYIVPHRRLPKSLFCNVTSTILNRIPAEVVKHVQGKRYKRMKEHVKVQVIKTGNNGDDDQTLSNRDFDADLFEFENSQVVYSDEDEEQGDGEDEGDELETVKKASLQEEDDDMADLYPDDESNEGSDTKAIDTDTKADDDTDETMEEKPQKKRRAKSSSGSKTTRHRSKKVKMDKASAST
uniref:Surfeit locus protein 2 n=1 Tax=Hyaloperonospora arabidopsidis (strain Emoy2) TaxID=559515 RepID=M4B7S7_HYAAE